MKVGSGGLQSLLDQKIAPAKRIEETQDKKNKSSLLDPGINKPVHKVEELVHAVEQMNKTVNLVNKDLKFEVHEETERIMVKVLDHDSGEVIKEFPPEEFLDMLARMKEAVGVLMDKYV